MTEKGAGMTESNLRLPRPDKPGLAMTENIYPSTYIDPKKSSFYYTLTKKNLKKILKNFGSSSNNNSSSWGKITP